MSAMIHFYSEDDRLEFSDSDGGVLWIRSPKFKHTVSFDLSPADRAKLRAVLDEADAVADKT